MQRLLACLLLTPLIMAATPTEQADIERLIKQLGAAEFEQRERASKELVKIGKPALDALRQAAAKHADAEVRLRANRAVAEIELADPVLGKQRQRLLALVEQLDGPTFQEREAAMTELSKLDKEALPLLQAVVPANPGLELQRRLQLVVEKIKSR